MYYWGPLGADLNGILSTYGCFYRRGHVEVAYPIVGFTVGVIVGLTGVGGGSLMTPILVLAFRVPPLTAVGTDLLFAAITKIIGVAAHGLRGQIEWRVVRLLALGSIPAAVLAVSILSWMTAHSYSTERFVLRALAVALFGTALAIIYRHRIGPTILSSRVPKRVVTVWVGIVLGVVVSFTSVGSGAMGIAALMLLYPSMRPSQVVGTDLAHAIPLVTIAGLAHMKLGNLNSALLLSLLIGSAPGVWFGTMLSSRIPAIYLRNILVCVLLVVGLVCIWR